MRQADCPAASVNYNAANKSGDADSQRHIPPTSRCNFRSMPRLLVLDAEGRQLDGDGDGTPGGSYTALLNDRGVVAGEARSLATVREALATHLRLG